MKIVMSEPLKNLDGTPIDINGTGITVGKALGVCLVADEKTKDPLRSYLLAKKMQHEVGAELELELDASEVAYAREAVLSSMKYTPLVKGQLLEKLTA